MRDGPDGMNVLNVLRATMVVRARVLTDRVAPVTVVVRHVRHH